MGKRVCASLAEVFFCFWFMLAEPGVVLLAWGGYVFPGGYSVSNWVRMWSAAFMRLVSVVSEAEGRGGADWRMK